MNILALLLSIFFGIHQPAQPVDVSHPPIIEAESDDSSVQLAICLRDSGVKFYGAYWCPHCSDQKERFGSEASKMLPYVECDPRGEDPYPEACRAANITSYPTWIFPDRSQLVGTQDLEVLADQAGCPFS